MLKKNLCRICRKRFSVNKFHPHQKVCFRFECRRKFRKKLLKEWRRDNPDYWKSWKRDTKGASVRWRRKNPGYYKKYRERCPGLKERTRNYVRAYRERNNNCKQITKIG